MTAHSALYYTVKVAGGGPSVHACAVFLRAESRDGDKFNQTPLHEHQIAQMQKNVLFYTKHSRELQTKHLKQKQEKRK